MSSSQTYISQRLPCMVSTSDRSPKIVSPSTALENITCDQRYIGLTNYAKLLWYLTSGKSHVGYLFDYDDNPLNIYVDTAHSSLVYV